jgi:hypothetical protein
MTTFTFKRNDHVIISVVAFDRQRAFRKATVAITSAIEASSGKRVNTMSLVERADGKWDVNGVRCAVIVKFFQPKVIPTADPMQAAKTPWQKHVAYCAIHHEGDTSMPSPYANR